MLPSPLSPAIQTPEVPAFQTSQPHQKNSLASQFHIYQLIERLSKEIETGDSDSMVSELKSRFENCQKMLHSISGSIGSKAMTVDRQKRKLEESEKLLEQRRLLYNMKIVSHPKSKKQEEEEERN